MNSYRIFILLRTILNDSLSQPDNLASTPEFLTVNPSSTTREEFHTHISSLTDPNNQVPSDELNLLVDFVFRDHESLQTYHRILYSYDWLNQASEVLNEIEFKSFFDCFHFDSPDITHETIMSDVDNYLNSHLDSQKSLLIRKILVEINLEQEVGLGNIFYQNLFKLVRDLGFYVKILNCLLTCQRLNLNWSSLIKNVEALTQNYKPEMWPVLELFLMDMIMARDDDPFEDAEFYSLYCSRILSPSCEAEEEAERNATILENLILTK